MARGAAAGILPPRCTCEKCARKQPSEQTPANSLEQAIHSIDVEASLQIEHLSERLPAMRQQRLIDTRTHGYLYVYRGFDEGLCTFRLPRFSRQPKFMVAHVPITVQQLYTSTVVVCASVLAVPRLRFSVQS